MTDWQVITGDCLEVMRGMDADSVDAVVTDPPSGISFMGKKWDSDKGGRAQWVEWMTAVMAECLRVLKPGGHALVWALPRTAHWTACAVEDAGFEIRDKVYHIFSQGFPKSLDIGKAIDKMAGAEREVIGIATNGAGNKPNGNSFDDDNYEWKKEHPITAPATPAAQQWDGWHTALKPAVEEWILARKPIEGTVAANVLKYGTGGLNVGACRVGTEVETWPASRKQYQVSGIQPGGGKNGATVSTDSAPSGRYPAHLIHDGSPDVLAGFPVTNGNGRGPTPANTERTSADGQVYGFAKYPDLHKSGAHFGDTGSAARFFQVCPPDDDAPARWLYAAKASKRDRDEGLEGFEEVHRVNGNKWTDQDYRVTRGERPPSAESGPRRNVHPTVKPTALMRYLCRLITPPGGVILDPFAGSGSTGKGALLEGFSFLGIEQDSDYADIARARIAKAAEQARQLELL